MNVVVGYEERGGGGWIMKVHDCLSERSLTEPSIIDEIVYDKNAWKRFVNLD